MHPQESLDMASGISNVRFGCLALATLAGCCVSVLAQSAPPAPAPGSTQAPAAAAPAAPAQTQTRVVRSSGIPQRDTLLRLMKPITIDFNDTRLEDAIRFLTDVTGADIEPLWLDDRSTSGMNKDSALTFSVKNATALDVIDRILEKIPADELGLGGGAWQMSNTGAIQIGPKERLNRFKRVEIYPIRDLLIDLPDYTNAPNFDLNSVLQQGSQGGGGGGQSPFEENDQELDRRTLEERANELVDILTQLVETEQWVQNGGDGGTMRVWRDSLIVNAPDYMHRGLGGYSYWPDGTRVVKNAGQRRYVTLGVDTSIGTIDEIGQFPVTAVTGGGTLAPSNPGPGGSTAPAPAAPAAPAATPSKP
jgi:hypothetical protein